MVLSSKPTNKRTAPIQSGPRAKKVHLDKHKVTEKKRSRPITLPVQAEASGSDSEEDLDGFEVADEVGDEQEPVGDDENVVVDGDSEKNPAKDPQASRESHKVQKALHEQRRAAKPHSNLLVDAKRVWSLARQKNIPTAERQKHVKELMSVIKGKVKDIVFKHDASRIVQTAVKYGGQKERDEIVLELKGKYKELAQNKYSKFLITKLIRLCPSHRASILLEFQPQVLRLLLHREATSVLADAFELYATAYERTILLREFYGKEATLFTLTTGSNEDKEKAKKGLSGILEGVDVDRRQRTLSALKENLTTIFNNPDKGAITHALVHRALWEYICCIETLPEEPEKEKLRRDMFETCQEVLAEMVHTRDGSRVVREFFARGSAKDRKQMLKVLKPHIERMCLDDEAQLVLFTALDVTDDTKLLSKSLISEITNSALKLSSSAQGRRSLLYLIAPRSRRHFTPAQIASLAETDEIRLLTSKKSPESREGEIRKLASEALISWIHESGSKLVLEPGGSLVVAEIMLSAEGDKSSAIATLLQTISSPYPSLDPANPHPVDLAHTSRVYKTLLQGGHFSHKLETIEKASNWDAGPFAVSFVTTLPEDVVIGMCTKRERNGTFIIAELCQALSQEGVDGDREARNKMKAWFSLEVLKEIGGSDARGKRVLIDKLSLL